MVEGGQVMYAAPQMVEAPQVQYVVQGAEQQQVQYLTPQEPGQAVQYVVQGAEQPQAVTYAAPPVQYIQGGQVMYAAPQMVEAPQVQYVVQGAEQQQVQYVTPQEPGQAVQYMQGGQVIQMAQPQVVSYGAPIGASIGASVAAPIAAPSVAGAAAGVVGAVGATGAS